MVVAVSVEDKGKGAEVAAGTAAGIAGGIAGFTLGLLIVPGAIVFFPIATAIVAGYVAVAETEDALDLHVDVYLKMYPDDDNT